MIRCWITTSSQRTWLVASAKTSASKAATGTGRSSSSCAPNSGYADYLGALQRYRLEQTHDPVLSHMSSYLLRYPFADRLYPRALDVLARAKAWGTVVILTDGDIVFQPHKIARPGLRDAVEGRVLIYIHKEHELADVERRYPADHYVLVDDKLAILAAVKAVWGPRVTTVFLRQGNYARDPKTLATYAPADIAIDRIGDLLAYDLPPLLTAAAAPGSSSATY